LTAASPLALAADKNATSTMPNAGNPAFDTQETVGGRRVVAPNGSLDRWASDYSTQHNGKITREAYMDELGRRWEAMDREGKGLTPREVSQITGHVDSNAGPAVTGSGVQPQNMGPGNSRGK
jgi:hypothetical protein